MYELMLVRTVQAKPVGSILRKRFVLMLKSVYISINCIRLASFCGTYGANPAKAQQNSVSDQVFTSFVVSN